ncbi:hypothetical protein C7212DRAFT_342357 [Tuber magnatum]|uniref:C2H2-type domain-containing protein n=1 Tax=Tuber magnatum TaxID=42249 RepID=A0A317SU52_9PEZI|nr:hypothetical protein C7212DRAFT_342357 [Tuber magnatum]
MMPCLAPQAQPGASLSLVAFDERGNRLGLPAGLGDLPLHPDCDGWYSTIGPWKDSATQTGTPDTGHEVNRENDSGTPVAPANRQRSTHPGSRSFCRYNKCPGNIVPHTCAPSGFACRAPNCSWPGTFKTKQALNRHYRAKHLNDRVDCPVEGCVRVGDCGIKRADNLAAHLLNKHGIHRGKT